MPAHLLLSLPPQNRPPLYSTVLSPHPTKLSIFCPLISSPLPEAQGFLMRENLGLIKEPP